MHFVWLNRAGIVCLNLKDNADKAIWPPRLQRRCFIRTLRHGVDVGFGLERLLEQHPSLIVVPSLAMAAKGLIATAAYDLLVQAEMDWRCDGTEQ